MRLIDADALIENLEYDAELDTRALDDADLLLGRDRELVQFDKDCKQNTIDILKNAPTVDAVPVQWLYDLAEKKEEEKDTKLSLMIKGVVALWHMEQEKHNESD